MPRNGVPSHFYKLFYQAYIKSLCEPFNPNRVNYYKSLLGTVNETDLKVRLRQIRPNEILIEDIFIRRVLTLQCKYAADLAGQTIILMGNLSGELSYIRQRIRGGESEMLRVRDSTTGEEFTYEGKMRPSDFIDNVSSFNVAFKARRWAVRKADFKGQKIIPPTLMPVQDVGSDLIKTNKYYVNIEITRWFAPEFVGYFTYPETDVRKLWRPEPQRPAEDEYVFSGQDLLPPPPFPVTWVPVEAAEDLASIHPIRWGAGFVDALFEKRIIVLGREVSPLR